MARERNLSPWAYWRLRLEAAEPSDPCPVDRLDTTFESWRGRARSRLIHALGSMPRPVPLDVEILESTDCDGYRRDKIVFDTEKTMSVPAYLLVPHERTEPGPAVLAVHGHGPGKSVVVGLEGEGQDYAHTLASRGFVVLAPDLRCFGERSDWVPEDKYECDWNLVCATLAGENPLAQNLFDMQRGLDVLAAHPLVDGTRLGAAGFSYGATITLFLAAIDPRVRAAVVSGYLSSWREAHTVPWNMCGSQVFGGMLDTFEHLDIASLVAPRALFVESGVDDVIFPIGAARATVDALTHVYAFLDAPERLAHHVHDGEHQWDGAGVAEFLEQSL